jgi:predicted nucleotidyltransferase
MTKKTAPYRHISDNSACWTKNCRRGNTLSVIDNLRVGNSSMTFKELDEAVRNKSDERALKINEAMRNKDFSVLLPSIEPKRFNEDETILFKTIHGSHLYGLNHKGSDEDYYTVIVADNKTSSTAHNKSKQTIKNGIDSLQVSLNHFVKLAQDGSHQALEAMFSQKVTGDVIEDMRKNYYVGTNIFMIYERTIRNFSLSEDFKRRRHALRLTLNLNEMMETGRFNPTLTPEQAATITHKTNATFDEYFTYINELSDMEIDWQKTDRASTVRR